MVVTDWVKGRADWPTLAVPSEWPLRKKRHKITCKNLRNNSSELKEPAPADRRRRYPTGSPPDGSWCRCGQCSRSCWPSCADCRRRLAVAWNHIKLNKISPKASTATNSPQIILRRGRRLAQFPREFLGARKRRVTTSRRAPHPAGSANSGRARTTATCAGIVTTRGTAHGTFLLQHFVLQP